MNKDSKIFIAGHKGMVGSAIARELIRQGYTNIITRSKAELNLLDYASVLNFFNEHKPEFVFLAAAKVGGIKANMENPGSFLFENLQIQNNIIHASYLCNVEKFCFLGSSCIYPKNCEQPMKEEYLLSGKLEPTNEGYAIAKIAGLSLCRAYEKQYGFKTINPMPCNLYGENDSFDLEHSHVLSALVKRFVDAVENQTEKLELWGSGIARREFLNVQDLAVILIDLMNNYDSSEIINIGSGIDISIKDLAEKIAHYTGFKGEILWDKTKPDGMLRKCMDVSKMTALGYAPKISLDEGLQQMILDYKKIKTGI